MKMIEMSSANACTGIWQSNVKMKVFCVSAVKVCITFI